MAVLASGNTHTPHIIHQKIVCMLSAIYYSFPHFAYFQHLLFSTSLPFSLRTVYFKPLYIVRRNLSVSFKDVLLLATSYYIMEYNIW